METILGLDVGTNSIGWAVVDKENQAILDVGVRIFKAGSSDIGQGEKEKSSNADRRAHRQTRRQHYRKRLRKIKLLQTLIENEMCPLVISDLNSWKNWDKSKQATGRKFPDSPEFVEWVKLNPYELRNKAINENISKYEFGRILYHFIHRRGFLSTRKGKDKETGIVYKGVEETRKLMDGKTLGQKLYEISPKENMPFKTVFDEDGNVLRVRARYTLRDMYVEEFERIWQKQSAHLGLNDIQVSSKKTILLEGEPGTSGYDKKLGKLRSKYGEKNIKVDDCKVNAFQFKSFKEFLAGTIENSENGRLYKSNESVLFWQRPLRSQKKLLGKCTFENRLFYDKSTGKSITTGNSPCPVSHPEYELFRAYQFINNITFGTSERLNDIQRRMVLELLNKNDRNFEFEKIAVALNLTYEIFNYDNKVKVPANPTHKKIKPFFTDEQWDEHRHNIWHCFSFYEDPELLAEKLVRSYGLTKESAEKAAKQKLEDGYGNVSLKAIRNILPFLERKFQYSTAVVLGGVKNAFGSRWERFEGFHDEIINKVKRVIKEKRYKEYELIGEIKKLLSNPENNFGFASDDKAFRKLYHHSQGIEKKKPKRRLPEIENLRNPIVQKGLNETRRLVNDLLDKFSAMPEYGEDFAFGKIHVELGRELRSGKIQRSENAKRDRQNEKANELAKIKVIEFGLKPGGDNTTKYRLFEEIENKHKPATCPYTNKVIRITDLLGSQNLYQIEHIIPYSVSLDNSFINKTICESNFNRLKGELTPYEFYQINKDPSLWNAGSWDEVERRAYSLLPYPKAKRFTMKKRPENQEFISRQLNDTRYIGLKTANILKDICDDVMVMPGRLTSELRRLWGLNNIIHPITPLNLNGYKLDDVKSLPHYVILDQDGVPAEIVPVLAERPLVNDKQILLPGWYDGKKNFFPGLKFQQLKFEFPTNNLPKGKYWAKVNISKPVKFTQIITERPKSNGDSISFWGKAENSKFSNESLKRKIDADIPDGVYWGIFKVKKTVFVEPEKGKQPNIAGNQVLLYGEVSNNIFSSYIYTCETNIKPGKYWAVLDLDLEYAEFEIAINKPESDASNLYIDGTVDDEGSFAADSDPDYRVQTSLKSGKYYAVVSVGSYDGIFPVENPKPELKKGENMIVGDIWVNKQTGEIMFNPKKNRDDHRHHAIDAITVAMTDRSFLNKLSHYFGKYKERERGVEKKPQFDPPWEGFDRDVKEAIDNILVSYHRNSKILSKISKIITKSGKTYKSLGFAARGALHKQTFYGKCRSQILHSKDSNELKYEIGKDGKCVYYYHVRKRVTEINNHNDVNNIVDKGIRELIRKRLREKFSKDVSGSYEIPDNFFFDDNKKPALFLPNKNGEKVPVYKVRMKRASSKIVQVKDDVNKWVDPQNNHHVVIYLDENGRLNEKVISFWIVVERIKQGEPVYKIPEEGVKIVTTLQENDMFLLGLPDDVKESMGNRPLDGNVFSNYLYRVQNISEKDYTFRNHLAATTVNENEKIRIRSFNTWSKLNPIKVRVSSTGELKIL
jgi:CRISPR-associated endonuclease Csn1